MAQAENVGLRGQPVPIRRLLLLGTLLAALTAVALMGVYYLTTDRPLTMLPGISGVARNAAPHYLFSVYGLSEPSGVAASPDGQRVYVAEAMYPRLVHVYDRRGQELFTIARPDSTQLTRLPTSLAYGNSGHLYVTDGLRNEVQIYTADGQFLGAINAPDEGGRWAPAGIVLDREGNAFVADSLKGQQRVLAFDRDFGLRFSFASEGEGPGKMDYPGPIGMDSRGRVFVANTVGGRIDAFSPRGELVDPATTGKIGAGLPKGLYVDDTDRLYVVDTTAQQVNVYDLKEAPVKLLFTFGSDGQGNGQFRFPVGVAGDQTGRVYVADRMNGRLQAWTY